MYYICVAIPIATLNGRHAEAHRALRKVYRMKVTAKQKITFGEMRAPGVRRVSTAALRSLDGKPAAHARRRSRLGFNSAGNIGDAGGAV